MQDIIYKNSYQITLDTYLYFCDHPLGKDAVKRLKRWKILHFSAMCVSALLAIIEIMILQDFVLGLIAFSLCIIIAYKLFIHRKKLNIKQYKMIMESQMTDKWIRTTIFTPEQIVLEDGNATANYSYENIHNLTGDEEYYYLWISENFLFRLPKQSFEIGEPEAFAKYIQGKLESKI